MLFNDYVWNLYRNSDSGREAIAAWTTLTPEMLKNNYGIEPTVFGLEKEEDIRFWGGNEVSVFLPPDVQRFASKIKVESMSDAEQLYRNIIEKGIDVTAPNAQGKQSKFLTFCGGEDAFEMINMNVSYMTPGLYQAHPHYFLPYLFENRFYFFQEICDAFEIPIPPPPGKKNWHDRGMYYLHLNSSLHEFRKLHSLSPQEMCAFLYDFAPKALKENTNELPPPSKVWLITGGAGGNGDFEFLDNSDETGNSHWQGNIDTRRGDILLMYCVSPRSYIHSIWRATTDGFTDPFFYFHSTIWISHPIKTSQVTFKEMAEHPLISKNGHIRANLQGPSGKAFSVEEYEAILCIMKKKGQDISILPKITSATFIPNEELSNERDVEKKLVEPLLEKIGYTPNDWVRQMAVSMGCGERNYPDYAFGAKTKKGEEKAAMVLEAKFHIKIRRELLDAYRQAKSYALRLQSKTIVLAAVEGVWIFDSKNGFDFDRFVHKTWKELEHPDVLHEVRKRIGR